MAEMTSQVVVRAPLARTADTHLLIRFLWSVKANTTSSELHVCLLQQLLSEVDGCIWAWCSYRSLGTWENRVQCEQAPCGKPLTLALLSWLTMIKELRNDLCWKGLLRVICSNPLRNEQDPSCWTNAFSRASLCTGLQKGNFSNLRCWHLRDIFIFLLAGVGYISSSWKLFAY